MASSQPVTFITNANEFVGKLNEMGDRVADPRGLLEHCREIIRRQEEDVWGTEGAVLAGVWNAIVEPERKTNSEMLVASGKLKESMTGPTAGSIRGMTLRFHPKPYYGFFHQFGTATMDARPYSGITDDTYREIMRAFQEATEADLGV